MIESAYQPDLAYVHDVGFGQFATSAGPGILSWLKQAGICYGRVIDLGCGSGLWARQLVDAGYEVEGVDLSPAMIEMARRRVPEGQFHVSALADFEPPACRAVTAMGEVFNYLFDRRNSAALLRRVCQRIYRALETPGMLVFDVAEPGRSRKQRQAWFEGPDWACLVEYQHDDERARLTRRIVTYRRVGNTYVRGEETHRLQLWRPAELADMLRKIGFRVRLSRSYGEYKLIPKIRAVVARKD